jgi:predicted house-cleaning NTP pyrophosphatase (Maf/HAM1 superfamily)
MVKKLVGSYANVVGLPIAEVVEILESDFQVSLW